MEENINNDKIARTTFTSAMTNILQISLSNPDEASVAPLGWNLQQ